MQESRLQRSYKARLRNVADIREFCDSEGIPYETDFHSITQPTEEIRQDFSNAYALEAFPPSDLPEHGASTLMAFERKTNERHHGEMVTAVGERVGRNLEPGVEAIYIKSALNPAYREAFEKPLVRPVKHLIENQGIPVMHTSIGWSDSALDFKGLADQSDDLWKVTAFVTDSAGNEGYKGPDGEFEGPYQKHNSVSHAPPLVVHVGAAARREDGVWRVEGYSSANSPTFVAPVAPQNRALWDKEKGPGSLIGTSLAAPYAGGVLAALNRRYGLYLTREQILYALIATCEPVSSVAAFRPHTPTQKELTYMTNAKGLAYNPEYAGFGLIQPYKAEALLAQMVALTQKDSHSITVPIEDRIKVEIPENIPQSKDESGLYSYNVNMPKGIALKTTLDIEFAHAHGQVWLTSPSGTRIPLVMSRQLKYDDAMGKWNVIQGNLFSLSTTHAWAGESLQGVWKVESTEPFKQMQLNQHHFMARDIVAQLNIAELLTADRPPLHNAKRLTELTHEHEHWRKARSFEFSGMTLGGEAPHFESFDSIVSQLHALPSAFKERNRIHTDQDYSIDTQTVAGEQDMAGRHANSIDSRVHHYLLAAEAYAHEGKDFEAATMQSLAARQLLFYIPPYIDDRYIPAMQAVDLLERSISLHKNTGALDLAYYDCCNLYTAYSRIRLHGDAIGDADMANNAGLAMQLQRQEARALWQAYFGGGDPSAHRIEEGEMGFSDHERIGTDNVSQCLTIIARDPVTLKTGLVHLDHQANIRTLDTFFEHFGQHRLQVRLIGALHLEDHQSKENIERVTRYLADKNLDIISADILGGPAGPAAMVVDPHNFEVSERVPTKSTINAAIGNATLLFTKPSKPLVRQFDFTQSKQRAPIYLSSEALERIRTRYLPKNEAELEQYFADRSRNFSDRPMVIDHLQALLFAYRKEWEALEQTLNETLQEQGADQAQSDKARAALSRHGFYVGENAREANQPIHQWISDELMKNGVVQNTALIGPRLPKRQHRLGSVGHDDLVTDRGGSARA